jgi:hypothetical protein
MRPALHRTNSRLPRLILILLAVTLLAGCATKLAYRYADWYLLWKIDHYVDLNREQRAYVRGRLRDLLAHHQREALPAYESFVNDVRLKLADHLTREEVDWIFDRYEQLRADLVDRVLPDGAALLTSIDPGQIGHLERMLSKENDKADREVKLEPEVRHLQRASKTLDLLRDWVGPLSRQQEQRIKDLVRTLPDLDRSRLAYVQDRERELLNLLRSDGDDDVLRERLRLWLLFPERVVPAYGRSVAEFRQSLKQMALAIDALLTPPQRSHVLARLQSLINDIHSLHTS